MLRQNTFNNYTQELEKINLTKDDFPFVCRTCLTKDLKNLIPNVKWQNNVKSVMMLLIPLLNDEENMPNKLCEKCISALLKFYEFKEKCRYVQHILNSILKTNMFDKIVKESKDCDVIDSKEIKKSENVNLNELYPVQNEPTDVRIDYSSEEDHDNNTKLDIKGRENEMSKKDAIETIEIINTDKIKQKQRKLNKNVNLKECHLCMKMIKSCRYQQHIRIHTKEKPFACEYESCDMRFSQKTNMKRHMLQHSGIKPFICEICCKGFTQSGSLAAHKKIHEHDNLLKDGTDQYCCEKCGRTFKRASCYIEHSKKHDPTYNPAQKKSIKQNEKYNYNCDICNKAFRTKRLLRIHQLTHGEKTVLCSECGKKFYTKIALNSHLTVHTGEKKYQCNKCFKCFAHSSGLEVHMLIHKGEKKHKCALCEKTFTQSQHLRYHMSTHTGDKNYKCTFCSKTFAIKSNLTVHVRTHTGETPYTCNICCNGYTNSSALKRHMLKHSDSYQQTFYPCHICHKIFRDPGSVRRHKKTHVDSNPDFQLQNSNDLGDIKVACNS